MGSGTGSLTLTPSGAVIKSTKTVIRDNQLSEKDENSPREWETDRATAWGLQQESVTMSDYMYIKACQVHVSIDSSGLVMCM